MDIKEAIEKAKARGPYVGDVVRGRGQRTKSIYMKTKKPNFPALKVEKIKNSEDIVVGVNIPVINKSLIFADISTKPLSWDSAMAHAKDLGKQLPTKDELYILQYFRAQIAKIYPPFAEMNIWSQTSSQYSAYNAWNVSYTGSVYYGYKYSEFTAIPLSDLKLES